MTIETLGNIGEFVAAIGTIATLFYLAMQIRRSSEATRASSQQSLLDTGFDATFELGQNVELARIVGAGLLDFDSLDDRDKTSFSFLIQRYVGNLEKGLRLRKAGLIDRETLDSVGDGLLSVSRSRPLPWLRYAVGLPNFSKRPRWLPCRRW